MTGHKPRLLILGLDGVGFDLLGRFAADGTCPRLGALAARGASGPLESTLPPTTFPAWTSFYTGAFPASHGVTDFTVRSGYRVRFVGAGQRLLPTIFSHVEGHGRRAGAAWFPMTWPPETLRGWQIAGWDSPVTSAGDASFVHPRSLHREIAARFGADHLAFDTLDEFDDGADWFLRAAAELPRRIRRRAEIARFLLERHPVDVAAFYFGEADTAAHHFFAFHDPASPRRPADVDPRLASALRSTYRALDEACGLLLDTAGDDAAVVVLSDHGSGGSSDVAIHLNRALERAGLLAFRGGRDPLPGPELLRGRLPGLVPRGLRRALFRFAGGLAPALVESRLRFQGIDWSRTSAFSEELSYAPAVWLNQLGREPRGRVRFRDREAVAREVETALSDLRLDDGTPLVRAVHRREDLHRGAAAHLFPDLIVEPEPAAGFTPVFLPSRGRTGPVVERLAPEELLGRKGRSMPGCHTRCGVLAVAGPGIAPGAIEGARLPDATAVVADLTGVPAAPWFEGGIPRGLPGFRPLAGGAVAPPWTGGPARAYNPAEERAVARRLRDLGYLED
jgi:predicted AlkP superfamily phosphohydrolase/phosphomutase